MLVTIVARAQFGTRWPVPLLTVLVMVVISYVLVGVGPRTLGRQHPYRVALAGATAVRVLGRLFSPLAVAAHPARQRDHARARASATARSRPRSSCANSSTWPRSAASSSTASGR